MKNQKPHYRNYQNYSKYVKHQKSKLKKLEKFLPVYDKRYSQVLFERLEEDNIINSGTNALCLGARIGTEVKAFHKLGCFAVGIDLITSKDNKYVLYGDFHDLQFPSDSMDFVFTNSLDHVFDLNKVLAEIRRVLKPGGYFITEVMNKLSLASTKYESFAWDSVDDLLELINGFKLIKRTEFVYPWKGEHCVFKKI